MSDTPSTEREDWAWAIHRALNTCEEPHIWAYRLGPGIPSDVDVRTCTVCSAVEVDLAAHDRQVRADERERLEQVFTAQFAECEAGIRADERKKIAEAIKSRIVADPDPWDVHYERHEGMELAVRIVSGVS